MEEHSTKISKAIQLRGRMSLAFYDFFIFLILAILIFGIYRGAGCLNLQGVIVQSCLSAVILFGIRTWGRIYRQIWRYGGIQCYIRLLLCDAASTLLYMALEYLLPIERIALAKLVAFCCMNTLCALSMRMIYRYAYKCGSRDDRLGAILRWMLWAFAGGRVHTEPDPNSQKIRAAIIGAGSVGVTLAEELLSNPGSSCIPRCFIDNNEDKIGRNIHGLDVMNENEATLQCLRDHQIQQVVFAVPGMNSSSKQALYEYYQKAGFQIKVYDYPVMDVPGKKRQLREFEISDLLFRAENNIINDKTIGYYRDKVILITGGGGSIGSELCRQLAKMQPRQLIILDIYENCAYDLQQSLNFSYKGALDVKIEIANIREKAALERIFAKYHPDICIHAAAHKHVPLMENNCIEAVENNVFGTLNVLQCCETYGCGRFMMISTDKAVNPTNVMGATKRVCEMITQAYSTRGKVVCSATRFGNVLGSAGSVIPIFKRQIAAGGPVTVTDKRIIRYFMTIPEASQLVLTSGAMANNGDLFVLDMGKPIRIWDLALNMIRMSGVLDIEIVETGLRPGEKLYEELLVDKDVLDKTENSMIFIEHEDPVHMDSLAEKLDLLRTACRTGEDETIKETLRKVVPTYHRPEEVNEK